MALSDRRFFFFGTLRDPDISAAVFARDLKAGEVRAGVLAGYRAVCVPEDTAPVLMAEPGGETTGIVVDGLSTVELARLNFFESADYSARHLTVTLDGGESVPVAVWLDSHYTPNAAQTWHYDDWIRRHKSAFLQMTQAYMAFFESGDIAAAEACWEKLHHAHMAQFR